MRDKMERALCYRYLEILEDEGCLNEVIFDRPEWDDDDKYTIEYHGANKLIGLIPDDILVRLAKEDLAIGSF